MFERENIIKYMRADSRSYLSKKNTDCLKGIFAVVVVLAHIRGRLPVFNDTVVGQILTASGYLAVAVFFFLSAYGLQVSVDSKGVAYLQTFPRRRILPFYGTYLFVLMLYVLVYALSGELNTVKPYILFRSLIYGGTLIENGWYLQTALLFYIMFWAIFRFGKTETLRMVMIVAGMVLYCFLCIWLGMGAYAYVSVFAFPMGFWWRKREKKIEALLSSRRRFWMSYAALFLVFCVTLIFGNLPIFTRAWMLAIRSVSVNFAH